MKVNALLVFAVLAAGVLAFFRWRVECPPEDRVATARSLQGQFAVSLFAKAGIDFPPRTIHLRAFKEEGELELWARGEDGAYSLVHTFQILRKSGQPGPKRREGDKQVPEGFYTIDRFNPQSDFLLSLGLDYPNASDRLRSDLANPGFDIFIHGGGATIGCLPIGDDSVRALYIIASDAAEPTSVHIFPSRRAGGKWSPAIEQLAASDAKLAEFWNELAPLADHFERTRQLPTVQIGAKGQYEIAK